MGSLAFALAVVALASVAFGGAGKYFALGLGMFSVTAGAVGYRRRADSGWVRLSGSAAMALGLIATLLALIQVGLTVAALRHLGALFAT